MARIIAYPDGHPLEGAYYTETLPSEIQAEAEVGEPIVTLRTVASSETSVTVEAKASSPIGLDLTIYWSTDATEDVPFANSQGPGASPQTKQVVVTRDRTKLLQYFRAYAVDAQGLRGPMAVMPIDFDTIPELLNVSIQVVNESTVKVLWNGDDDVASVVVDKGSAPGSYTTNVGTYNAASGASDDVTVSSGETVYFRVTPYSQINAGGDAGIGLETWYRRPEAATFGPPTVSIRKTASGETSVDVEIKAESPLSLNLTLYWSEDSTEALPFASSQGPGTSPQTKSLSVTRDRSAALQLVRAYAIDSAGTRSDLAVFAIDWDEIPELLGVVAEKFDEDEVRVRWSGDDDVASVEIAYGIDTPGTYSSGTLGPYNLSTGVSGTVVLSPGETCYFEVTPYDATGGSAGGGTAGVPLYTQIQRPPQTSVARNPLISMRRTSTDDPDSVTIEVRGSSPDLANLAIYWSTDPAETLEFSSRKPATPATFDTSPQTQSVVVAIDKSKVMQLVRAYAVDENGLRSDVIAMGVDYDSTPELINIVAEQLDADSFTVRWNGDDDVASVVVEYGIDTIGTYNTTLGTYNFASAQATDSVTLQPGETAYFKVTPYSETNGTGNAGVPLTTQITRNLRSTIPFIEFVTSSRSTTSVTVDITAYDPGYVTKSRNGTFEGGFAYWKSSAAARTAMETTAPITGTASLKITSDAGADTYVTQVTDPTDDETTGDPHYYAVEPGDKVRLFTRAKTGGNTSTVRFETFNASLVSQGVTSAILSFTETVETTKEATYTVPAGIYFLQLRLVADTDASAPRDTLFDDVVVENAGDLTLYWTDDTTEDVGSFTNSASGTSPVTDQAVVAWDPLLVDQVLRAYAVDVDGNFSGIYTYVVDYDAVPELIDVSAYQSSDTGAKVRWSGDDDVASVTVEFRYDEGDGWSADNTYNASSGTSGEIAWDSGADASPYIYFRVTPYTQTGAGGTAGVPVEVFIQRGFVARTISASVDIDEANDQATISWVAPGANEVEVWHDTGALPGTYPPDAIYTGGDGKSATDSITITGVTYEFRKHFWLLAKYDYYANSDYHQVTVHRLSETPDLMPVVIETPSEWVDAGTPKGKLTLKVTDPEGSDLEVRWWTKSGLNAEVLDDNGGSWYTVTSGNTIDTDVVLTEKHISYIRYEVRDAAGQVVGNVVIFDADIQANIKVTVTPDIPNGVAIVTYAGDSDTVSLWRKVRGALDNTAVQVTSVSGKPYLATEEIQLDESVGEYEGAGKNSRGDFGPWVYFDVPTGAVPDLLTEIIRNGDFEEGYKYWHSTTPTRFTLETGTPISGSQSLRIQSASATVTMAKQTNHPNTVIDGRSYGGLVFVKPGDKIVVRGTARTTGCTAELYLTQYDTFKNQPYPVGNNAISLLTWTEATATSKTTSYTVPDGVNRIQFHVQAQQDASAPRYAYFDDVVAYNLTTSYVPTWTETITYDTSVSPVEATISLDIDDADGPGVNLPWKIFSVKFRDWLSGRTSPNPDGWSDWTNKTSQRPGPFTYTVPLDTKHNVLVEYQIEYEDYRLSLSTVGKVVSLDVDTVPEMTGLDVSVDDYDGTVVLAWAGDDDVHSIRYTYAIDGTGYSGVADPHPSGTVQTGRTGAIEVPSLTVSRGSNVYFKVRGYPTTDGSGTVYSEMVYAADSRGQDLNDDTIPPRVQAAVSYESGTPPKGRVDLTITPGTSTINAVQFSTSKTASPSWGAGNIDSDSHRVDLEEKHAVHIGWRVQYDTVYYLEDWITFDPDSIPMLTGFTMDAEEDGTPTFTYSGDDDTGSVRYAYAVNPASGWDSVTDPINPAGTANDGRADDVTLSAVTLASGDSIYYKILAYTGYTGGSSPAGEGTRAINIVLAKYTFYARSLYPVVEETVEEDHATGQGTITLVVTDPMGENVSVKYYEKDPDTGEFPVTPDETDNLTPAYPKTSTYVTTLLEDKNLYVKYEVVAGITGQRTVSNVVVFDPDKIPAIYSSGLDVEEDGTVELSWTGDSDLKSVRYHYAISTPADPKDFTDVTDPTASGNYFPSDGTAGRTGSDYLETTLDQDDFITLNQGETIYVKARGYNAVAAGGDYGPAVWLKFTRPVDTAGASNLVSNGDFESGLAYWGGIRLLAIGGGSYITLYSATTTAIDGTYSLFLNGNTYGAVNVYTSTSGELGANTTILCSEGDRIDLAATAYVVSGTTLTWEIIWYNSSKTEISSPTLATWTETTATTKTASVQAPANTAYAGLRFSIPVSSGDAYVDNVSAQFKVAFGDHDLSELGDVQASYSPGPGQVLTWNDTESYWEPADLPGGVTTLGSLTNVTDASSAAGWYLRSTEALQWSAQLGVPSTSITGSINADTLDNYDSSAFGRLAASNTWGSSNEFTQGIIVDSAVLNPTVRLDVGTNAAQRAPAGLYWTRSNGTTSLWRHAIETDDDLSFERWTGSAWSNVIRLGSDGVVNFASEPTVAGSPIGDGGNAATLDNLDSTQFLRSDTSDSFTGDTLTVESATPVLDFKFSTAPGGYVEIGPAWTDSGGQKQFRYLFDDTDLEFQRWNGSWATMLRFDVAYNRLEFVQRPTEDGYGAGTLGVPTGEVIFSGDDLDALADVNYTTTPTEGQALIWDNANQYWEPGSVAVGSHTLGSHSNVTDASTGAGWYLRTTGATTWAAQSGVPFSDITGTVDADTIDSIDSTNLAVITAQRTITANPWTFQNNNDTGYIDFKYGGSTTADKVVWARILDGTVEMWGWRYDVSGNVDDVYLVRGGATEVMRFDYSASLIEFASRPTVGGTTVALTTDAGAVANLDDIGDVSTDNASGDLLYNSSGTWIGRTPSELNLLTTTSIAAREEGTFKGWLDGPAIDFKAGSGASVTVADTSGVITVTYSVTGGTATNLVSSGSAYVQIDSDNSDTSSVFEVRSDSATPGAGTPLFQIEQPVSSNATIETYGTILKLGSLNTGVGGDDIQILGSNGTPAAAEFWAAGGQDLRLRVQGTGDSFWLSDGTSENRIAPIYGWATGTGSPGSVAAVKGALYFRYT